MNQSMIPNQRAGTAPAARAIDLRRGLALILFATVAAISVLVVTPSDAKSGPQHVAAGLEGVDVNDGFARLVKAVRPAVVNISVSGSLPASGQPFDFRGQAPELEEFFRRFFGDIPGLDGRVAPPQERKTTAVGSGFIVDPDGFVVTNHHVIENADEIEVVFEDGTRVPATLKGIDDKTDLALLQIATDRPLPYVAFGDSDQAEVGDWVVATRIHSDWVEPLPAALFPPVAGIFAPDRWTTSSRSMHPSTGATPAARCLTPVAR